MTHPVVVGFDGSANSRLAVAFAADLAQRRDLGLQLIHAFSWPLIYPPLDLPTDPHDVGPRMRVLGMLADAASDVRREHPSLVVETKVHDGQAAGVLVNASQRARFLVIAHRGRGGFKGLLAGSIAVQTAAHARCPTIVVRGGPFPTEAPVLVGVDGSAGSRAAARLAYEEAKLRHVELVVVHVRPTARTWPETATTDPVEASLAGVAEDFPDVKTRTQVRPAEGVPPKALVDAAREVGAGLVAIGSRGLGGFHGLRLGGTSRGLVDHAECPVAVVPSDVTP